MKFLQTPACLPFAYVVCFGQIRETGGIRIRLPDDWDRLIAPMGYEPLAQFLLPAADTGAAAAGEGAAPAVTAEDGIKAPLSDGDYRLVPSMAQMTEEGRICLANGGAVSAWAHGADGPETLVPDGRWAALLDSLFTGCSFTVSGGQATAVTLRPQAGGGHVTGLDEALIAALGIRLETVPRQSREAGKATPDGASMILSVRISSFSVDLGGPLAADPDGTPLS